MALTIVDTLTDRSQKSQISDGVNDLALQSVSGIQAIPVSVLAAVPEQSAVAALTQIAVSVTSIPLLAANASRKGVMFFNDAKSVAYVAFAATSSAAAYSLKLPAGSLYERELPIYTGPISVIWAAADSSGHMQITELT